jgi:hypothetical protein
MIEVDRSGIRVVRILVLERQIAIAKEAINT